MPRHREGSYITANGSALVSGGQFLYWYQAGPRNSPESGSPFPATATNRANTASPVLESGPRGSWDERGVADPYVRMVGDRSYMFYLGQDRARRQRIGIARSRDGIKWEKRDKILSWSYQPNGFGGTRRVAGPRIATGCCTPLRCKTGLVRCAWRGRRMESRGRRSRPPSPGGRHGTQKCCAILKWTSARKACGSRSVAAMSHHDKSQRPDRDGHPEVTFVMVRN